MEQKNKKLDLPFDGPYKTKPSAVPGKHGIGFSTARHLARQGMAQQVKKAKTNEDNEQDVAEGSTSQQKAHEYNLDAAQKEMDSRHAEGEDMTGAKIDKKTYQIVKPKKPKVNEAEMDPREYDYEGDMAKSQLKSIIMNAQQVHDMLEDDTNMAEWVQSKITLAADYISTVADYMAAEMKEEVESIDEISTKLLAKAANAASVPDSDYHYGKSHDPQKFADRAKKTKDAKSAAAVQGAADAKGHYPRPGHTLGSYDKLAHRSPARVTNAGKANKQDVNKLKGNIKRNEEVEPIDELSKDTIYSYAKKSEKDQDKQFNKISIGIRDKDPKSANTASHKFTRRSIGQGKAENRLNTESFKNFRAQIAEKHLTPAEMKKREEIAKAIHKENPGMPMGNKMAIATASAKKAA